MLVYVDHSDAISAPADYFVTLLGLRAQLGFSAKIHDMRGEDDDTILCVEFPGDRFTHFPDCVEHERLDDSGVWYVVETRYR